MARLTGTGVKGKTLGIYAFNRIGSIVARIGRAVEMHVVCWSRAGVRGRLCGNGEPRSLLAVADVLIPTRADHHALDALAQSRRPMDMMIQGWSMRRFQASQQ